MWTADQSRLMVIVRGALEMCQADKNGGLNALLNDRHSILVECPIRARVVADEAGEPRIKLVISQSRGDNNYSFYSTHLLNQLNSHEYSILYMYMYILLISEL